MRPLAEPEPNRHFPSREPFVLSLLRLQESIARFLLMTTGSTPHASGALPVSIGELERETY